ncbi:hypothetical protein FACS189447_03560 [Spirochaetia bacterium]|nr:hypothetical protein FACS189447_03560 [Spirochaetia bacterium]
MYRKILVLFFLAILLIGCQTTRVTPAPGEGSVEYRGIQEEIRNQQTEIAISGAAIEHGAREITSGLTDLEKSMSAAEYTEADRQAWLSGVHVLRGQSEGLQSEIVNLNFQLSQEREKSSLLSLSFNKFENIQLQALSEKDTEINRLAVENKKVKGQRNTLMAIVITAITVIVLSIAVKVLRAMRVIPF